MSDAALAGWIIGGCAALAVLFVLLGVVRAGLAARGLQTRVASVNERTAVLRAQNAADDVARIQKAVELAPPLVERARAAIARIEAAIQTIRRVGLAVAAVRAMISGA